MKPGSRYISVIDRMCLFSQLAHMPNFKFSSILQISSYPIYERIFKIDAVILYIFYVLSNLYFTLGSCSLSSINVQNFM